MSKRDSEGCGTALIWLCIFGAVAEFLTDYGIYLICGVIVIVFIVVVIKILKTKSSQKEDLIEDNKIIKPNYKIQGNLLKGGKYKGGRDIKVGIYDIEAVSGSGSIKTNYPEEIYCFLSWDANPLYKNIEISENTVLTIDTSISIDLYNRREYIEKNIPEGNIKENVIHKEKSECDPYKIDLMDGHNFELFCAEILKKQGYQNVEVTKGSGDQGVDIIAKRDGIKYAVQCKRYSQPVGNKAVQEIYFGKDYYYCHVGIIMTNNYFTSSAKEAAKKNGIILWDRDFLMKFLNINEENDASPNDTTIQLENYHVDIDCDFEKQKEEENKMYDKENGIYPPGIYVVGDDIEIGKYLLKAKTGEHTDPMISFYETYSAYRKEEINQLERFDDDYYLSLRENGMVIAVRDADIKKL